MPSCPLATRRASPLLRRAWRWLLPALASALTAWPAWQDAPAAHELEEQRRAVISVHPGGVDLLVMVHLPATARGAALWQSMDWNRNGRIDRGWEQWAMAQQVLPRLLDGWRLDGTEPALRWVPEGLQARLVEWVGADRAAVSLVGLLQALRASDPGDVHTWTLTVPAGGLPLQVEVQAVDGMHWRAAGDGDPWQSVIAGPLMRVAPGETWRWETRRPPPESPPPSTP